MKKKIFRFPPLLLLALLLFFPTGYTAAKYTQKKNVGTVQLTITIDSPTLDQNWKQDQNWEKAERTATKLVVDSFNNQEKPGNLNWDKGTNIGQKSGSNYTDDVRLFMSEDEKTAYLLAWGDCAVIFPKDSTALFTGLTKLTEIEFNKIDTSNVTNMSWMFTGCTSLKSLKLSNFNTSKVTDMSGMFYSCRVLESLNLSNFDTSNVTNMSTMFSECSGLTSLTFSENFKTSNVTDMNAMFYNCSSLTSLDLSSFKTGKVTNMMSMFHDCQKLAELNLSSFNTDKVVKMAHMFDNCTMLGQVTLGENFKFVGEYSYLPAQTNDNIPGADGMWYIDRQTNGYAPADIPDRTVATTYYAVQSEAPASVTTTTFVLRTDPNGEVLSVGTTD